MKRADFASPSRTPSASDRRRRIARRVAEAHRGLDPGPLLAFVSGSTVENLADQRSDVDMSVVLDRLPDAAALQSACARAGGTPWFWTAGDLGEGGLVVAFRVEGIETQIAYTDRKTLAGQIDELLVEHNPDTPLHKLGEGILKAEPLAGAGELAVLQQRLASFPDALARAMLGFWLGQPTPWKAIAQLVHRDADVWCRELIVDAAYRLLGVLAALNGRYFTRFQVKRVGRLAGSFAIAPPRFAERIGAMLVAPPAAAFDALFALEGEMLALVASQRPDVDLAAPLRRRADREPAVDQA